MSVDLRSLLAEAYRNAALGGADMLSATRAFEAIREAATGTDPVFSAFNESRRHAGRVTDGPLVTALIELSTSIEAARTKDDIAATRKALEQNSERGWAELRRRFARAFSEFNFDVASSIAGAELDLPQEQQGIVKGWLDQLRFARREKWDKALNLFDSLGHDPVVDAADRARFLSRATQVHLYFTRDEKAGDLSLSAAKELLVSDATAEPARAEVMCVEGQSLLLGGDTARARAILAECMALDPKFEDGYKEMGDSFLFTESPTPEDVEEAERWYDRGIENAPGGTSNVVALARLLGDPARYSARRLRVAELRQHALRVTPAHRYSLYSNFADIALQNNELDEAQHLVGQAIAEDGSRAEAWVIKARISIAQRDPLKAISDLGNGFKADAEGFAGWEDLSKAVALREGPDDVDAFLSAIDEAFGPEPSAGSISVRIELLEAGLRWEDAEAVSERLLLLDKDADGHRRRLGLLHNSRGNRAYEASNYAEAVRWYDRAVAETPDDAVIWSNLALALENDVTPDGRAERLSRAVSALDTAISVAADAPEPEYPLRRKALAAKHRLAQRFGARVLDFPVITPPLGLDVGPDLLGLIVAPGTSLLSDRCAAAVTAVRERVSREYGLTLPGINFRDLTDAEPGQYLALLGGISVTQRVLPTQRLLLFGAPPPMGTPADLPPAFDPLSGKIGYWIRESDVSSVEGVHSIWTVLDFALHDLAAVYLKNVRTELTLDIVATLMQSSEIADAAAVAADPGVLHRITHVVRCLVAEGAPATELGAITELVRGSPDQPVTTLVETARMLPTVREHLNSRLDGGTVEVGPVLSRMVRAAIWKGDAEPALAIAPEECQEFLGVVRETLNARGDRNVIITDDDLRPFIRWMLEIEFPDVPVLARRELLRPLTDFVVADKRTEQLTQEIVGYEYAGARVPA